MASSSTTTVIQTPQSDFTLQLAQLLQQIGASAQQWANQAYAQTGTITADQINNYLQLAQQGANLAGQTMDQYTKTYGPAMDQYTADAQSWASPERLHNVMGAAQSDAEQAQNAAKINAENELQSFGIDPSSGRYQDLVRVSATQGAAASAAAGEMARRSTEDQANQRKQFAIQAGLQLPGMAVNAINSAYAGVAGAENSALGLLNAGTNAMKLPADYYGLAMRPLQPLQGQNSTTGGGGGGGGGKSSDPFNMDRFGRTPPTPPPLPTKPWSPPVSSLPGSYDPSQQETIQNPYYQDNGLGGYNPNDPYSNLDPTTGAIGQLYDQSGYNAGGGWWDPSNGDATQFGSTPTGNWDSGFQSSPQFDSSGFDYGQTNGYSGWYDPGSSGMPNFDSQSSGSSDPSSGWSSGFQSSPDANWNTGNYNYTPPDYSGGQWSDPGSPQTDYGMGDYNSYAGGDYAPSFADGGVVGAPTAMDGRSGPVSDGFSPSSLSGSNPASQPGGNAPSTPMYTAGGARAATNAARASARRQAPQPSQAPQQPQEPQQSAMIGPDPAQQPSISSGYHGALTGATAQKPSNAAPGGGWVNTSWAGGDGQMAYVPSMKDYYMDLGLDYPRKLAGAGPFDFTGDPSFSPGNVGTRQSFARGGMVPSQGQRPQRPQRPMGGGHVPPSMSPSGGQRTDDIPAVIPQTGGRAMINAGEFVLPKDVVAWKGQEFFQKMIDQARRARVGGSAKPTARPPSGGFHGQ